MRLEEKECADCGTEERLDEKRVKAYMKEVSGWKREGKKIRREWEFKDFVEAMKFVNRVAELAEENSHHPDFQIHWNKVLLELWTHSKDGLTENDFIVAAKINGIGKDNDNR